MEYIDKRTRQVIGALLILQLSLGQTTALLAIETTTPEFLITPNSVGLVRIPNSIMQELGAVKQLYPKAIVSIEKGQKNKFHGVEGPYFVFKQDDVELFRAPCRCRFQKDGRVDLEAEGSHYKSLEEIHISPIATSPQYQTERGIRVGSTLKQLKDAYKEFGPLYVIGDEASYRENDFPSIEYACFRSTPRSKSALPERFETLRFYLTPSDGKKTVGVYKRPFDAAAYKYDVNAHIYGIEPVQDCLPWTPIG